MKKLLILAILLLPSMGLAAPWLISDPYISDAEHENPVSATILQDGIEIATDIALESDMSIKYDLTTMPVGMHTYTGFYKDQYGRQSEISNPFVLKGSPNKISNIRLVP